MDVTIEDFNLHRDLTAAERATAVIVNWLDWQITKEYDAADPHRQYAEGKLKRLGVSPDTHVVVGDYYRDLSGWCEYEQKMEFFHDERVLVIPA